MTQRLTLVAAFVAALVGAAVGAAPAFAQKEMMGMFYEMQMAPTLCKWTDVPGTAKLDAQITTMEPGLAVTDAERAAFKTAAEADLKADPSNCEKDGLLHAMYVDTAK